MFFQLLFGFQDGLICSDFQATGVYRRLIFLVQDVFLIHIIFFYSALQITFMVSLTHYEVPH